MLRFLACLLLTLGAAHALPFDHSQQSYTNILQQHVI
jgi:hypothetical protein